MSQYIVRGSGRHYPEIVQKVRDVSDTLAEVRRVGELVNGAVRYDAARVRGTKYVKHADMEPHN